MERPIAGPFPEQVPIVRANRLYIKKEGLPSALINRLLRVAAFQNPEFYQAQAMRRSTYATPRIIACGDDLAQYVALPRGCLADTLALLAAHHIAPDMQDERFAGTPIDVAFHGQLRAEQQEAATTMLASDDGILCAPTAFGKTAVAAWLIAQRQVSTLVLVHRQQLLDQWHARLMAFLDLTPHAIGQIGGGKRERTGQIDVAVIQSLHHQNTVNDLVAEYGQVVVDECHHLAAFSFEQVMKQVKARYVVGLTATPTRKDGHHPIIGMQCGPIRFAMSQKTMTDATPFAHQMLPCWTEFRFEADQSDMTIQEVYAALIHDTQRNDRIVADVEHALAEGRTPLVLTNRTAHVQVLATRLAANTEHVFVLRGGMGKHQRRAVAEGIASVRENESRVIVATGSAIGEGFDDARLDTLFLVMPISWKGTLQ
ncbi:MAG TPA: DEAD/DEAH box helicase family protein, partial [Ktedonobacterales bacterium]|nr:DEAD/DEAH box helicase family protein [Ktedonobacterales bacterium]